jgi:hypothetical protein
MNPSRKEDDGCEEVQQRDRVDYLERLMLERDKRNDRLLDELDRRYEQRFASTQQLRDAEIRSIRSSSDFMLSTFKEAISKAELQQNTWNVSHNDLVRKMEDQYQHMMPREEAMREFNNIKDSIGELRESRSEHYGKGAGLHAGWAYLMGGVILIATMVHLIISLITEGGK